MLIRTSPLILGDLVVCICNYVSLTHYVHFVYLRSETYLLLHNVDSLPSAVVTWNEGRQLHPTKVVIRQIIESRLPSRVSIGNRERWQESLECMERPYRYVLLERDGTTRWRQASIIATFLLYKVIGALGLSNVKLNSTRSSHYYEREIKFHTFESLLWTPTIAEMPLSFKLLGFLYSLSSFAFFAVFLANLHIQNNK